MAERRLRDQAQTTDPELDKRLETLDQDLDIMEKHAAEMAETETGIQEEMRKRDREHKDVTLHSTPRPRKHLRS